MVADSLEVQWDPEEEAQEDQTRVYPVLCAMMVAGHAVHEEEGQLSESYHLVGGHCGPQSIDVVLHFVCVIPILHKH